MTSRSPRAAPAWRGCAPGTSTAWACREHRSPRARLNERLVAAAALCLARAARRPARLRRVPRLHRARLHGDRRRRLARRQPQRRAGARGPGDPRRRSRVHADPARGQAGRARLPANATARCRATPPCAPWRAPATDKRRLVELKAVDNAYPLFGAVKLDPPGNLDAALAERDGVFGAVADPTLLARLDIKPGAQVSVGNAKIQIRAALASEPDKLAGGIGFGPRLMVSEAALRATGLVQPGSLVHWHYKLRLPPGDDQRRRGADGGGRGARATAAKPAGASAPAPRPRRACSATSNASPSSSPSSASPRCWSAASASATR